MMAVRAVLYCCAVLLLPFVLLVYESNEVIKNDVLLPEYAPASCQQIEKYVLGEKSARVLILGKAIPGIYLSLIHI